MYQTILVPFDGSDSAQDALELACRLAEPETTLIVLGVSEVLPTDDRLGRGAGAGASPMDADRDTFERAVHAELESAWAALETPRGQPEFRVCWGRPAHAIVTEAKARNADTIIMGSRGLTNLQSMAVGSVSHKVMHTAPCRVITVH